MTAADLTDRLIAQGIQCSDQGSFFSTLRTGYGCRCNRRDGRLHVELAEGEFAITERRAPGFLAFDVEAVTDAWVFDFAARWVLPADLAEVGRVGGELVPFGTPLMHAARVRLVRLGAATILGVGQTSLPEGLDFEMHLASEAGHWIVHARAVASPESRVWVKHGDGHSEPFVGGPIERRLLERRRERVAPCYESQARLHTRLTSGTAFRIGLTTDPAAAC